MCEIIQGRSPSGKQLDRLPACPRYNLSFSYHPYKDSLRTPSRLLDSARHEQQITFCKGISKQISPPLITSGSFKTSKLTSNYQAARCFRSTSRDNGLIVQWPFPPNHCGFPRRKKRQADQQLLNLLIRYADKLAESNRYQNELRKVHAPLFDQNLETHQKIIPKLKYRTRFNWYRSPEKPSRSSQPRHPVLKGPPVLWGGQE